MKFGEFSVDDLNMITAPASYLDGHGFFRHSNNFLCAYHHPTMHHLVRFPANDRNLLRLLEQGLACDNYGTQEDYRRFEEWIHGRLLQLQHRRFHFLRAEERKLNHGDDVQILFETAEWRTPAATYVNKYTSADRQFYYQQRVAVDLCVEVERALLAMEQRTGKTPTMQAVIRRYFEERRIDAVFVCAPVRLLNTAWWDELELYNPDLLRVVMAGDADRVEAVQYGYNVFLSSFESAAKNWAVVRELYPDPRRIMVVMDETIKIKNPDAKRALACMMISRQCGPLFELSGAPVSRLNEDIWTQAFCIDPGILGDHYKACSLTFFETMRNGRVAFRRDMKDLFFDLQDFYQFRCTRGEAEQFTGRDTYTINVSLAADRIQARVYDQMLQAHIAQLITEETGEVESEARNILVQLLRLREILGGFFSYETEPGVYQRVRLPFNPKSDWLRAYIDEHEGTQFIVFCEFDEEEEIIGDLLDELNVSWGGVLQVEHERARRIIVGNKEEQFASHVRDFQQGDRTVFLGKHSAIGHGLTLSAADAAIYWNMGFNSDNYDQSRQRPVAGGKCALIYHLMIGGSIETTKIYPTLKARGDMKATILKDVKRRGYYSFFEELGKDALMVASQTKYDIDPLEQEARRITGYDGMLTLIDINEWEHGDEPSIHALERIRGAGSIKAAYKKIAALYYGSDDGEISDLATECYEGSKPWWYFIEKARTILDVGERTTDKNPSRNPMFTLMLAYLRMRCPDYKEESA